LNKRVGLKVDVHLLLGFVFLFEAITALHFPAAV